MPTLEERVAALESIAGVSEAGVPTYISIDPSTGQTGATFTGLVHALGLVLPAGTTGVATPQNEVVWSRTTDNAHVAHVWSGMPAGYAGNQSVLSVQANNNQIPGVTNTAVEIDAFSPGTQWSELYAGADSTSDAATGAFATAVGSNGVLNNPTIIDGRNASSFLRNTTWAVCFAGITTGAVAAGTIEYLTLTGPNNRQGNTTQMATNGRYTAPYNGVFLCCASAVIAGNNAQQLSISVQNLTSAYHLSTTSMQGQIIGIQGAYICLIVPANKGDVIRALINISAGTNQINPASPLAGGSWFAVIG